MWCILMPQLLHFIGESKDSVKKMLEECLQETDLLKLNSTLGSEDFIAVFNSFIALVVVYGDGTHPSSF